MEKQSQWIRMPGKVEVQPVSIDSMYAEWVRPRLVSQDQAVLYLHGGGYTMGSCNTHRALAAHMAQSSHTAVLLIDYRLAPENRFPAALEDALKAYRWLLAQDIPARKVVIAGDSAGGGLTVSAATALRDGSSQLPGGLVCLSPWTDLTLSGESMTACAKSDPLIGRASSAFHAGLYLGQQDPASPLASPVFADLHGLPPMLIQVGEYETLRSDAERLAANARQAEVPARLEVWEGMWHVWQMFAGLMPEAQRAIQVAGKFIQERMEAAQEVSTAGKSLL